MRAAMLTLRIVLSIVAVIVVAPLGMIRRAIPRPHRESGQ